MTDDPRAAAFEQALTTEVLDAAFKARNILWSSVEGKPTGVEGMRAVLVAAMLKAAPPRAVEYHPIEHQFPEVDHGGTLVAYPCLLCGLPAGDALKQASDDRASFEADISRDVEVIHELEHELAEARAEIARLHKELSAGPLDHGEATLARHATPPAETKATSVSIDTDGRTILF